MVFCKLCQDLFNSIHSPSQADCIFQLKVQLDIGKLMERWRDVFNIRSDLVLPKEESEADVEMRTDVQAQSKESEAEVPKEEPPWESMC